MCLVDENKRMEIDCSVVGHTKQQQHICKSSLLLMNISKSFGDIFPIFHLLIQPSVMKVQVASQWIGLQVVKPQLFSYRKNATQSRLASLGQIALRIKICVTNVRFFAHQKVETMINCITQPNREPLFSFSETNVSLRLNFLWIEFFYTKFIVIVCYSGFSW